MEKYHVIGLMSGTSLDGVDIAYCEFWKKTKQWNYKIIKAQTVSYKESWKQKLSTLENDSAIVFAKTHNEYGHFLGTLVRRFINKHGLKIDFVSSHGHTIFHQPEKRITFQIGSGAAIAAECGCPVICDFRSLDVALGGQGAPLVPVGDALLFPQYDYRLNLGGFANISFNHGYETPKSRKKCGASLTNKNKPGWQADKTQVAFDICPVNIVINHLCQSLGYDFDDKGKFGKRGNVVINLMDELNAIAFYKSPGGPKSLGKEWLLKFFFPILNKYKIPLEDKIRTLYEHIAVQIARVINAGQPARQGKSQKILVTGGGTYNTFLMERIAKLTNQKIYMPDKILIEYKEALIFAFLGVLRMRESTNCLKSVTGALKNNVGGCIYFN